MPRRSLAKILHGRTDGRGLGCSGRGRGPRRPDRGGLSSLDEALLLLGSANDSVHTRAVRAHVHLVQGRILRLAGRVRRAWVALARASKLADQSGEVRLAVEAAARRGRLMLDVDREHDAELELREALLVARTTYDRRGEALVTLFLGTLLAERADFEADDQGGQRRPRDTHKGHPQNGDLTTAAARVGAEGEGAREARATLERSLRSAEELGLARVEGLEQV